MKERGELIEKLKKIARKDPKRGVNLIVHLAEPPSEVLSLLAVRGVKIRHKYCLMRAVAVEISAQEALRLEKEAWVTRIEEDREVHILREKEE